jgi:phytoene dehydrogenase-like protein
MIYDTILVGSSPLNLLEAIYLKQKGQKVLVIDRQSKIGGAWATTELNGLPDLEIGCHIWDIIPEVITFLGRYLELDLQPLQPQPRIKYGKTSFPYDWKHNALFLKKLAYHTKHFSWEKMHAENKEVKKYRFSILPKKYCYPVGGQLI